MNNENFKNYIKHIGLLLKEQAKAAKLDAERPEEGWEDYNEGQLMAYHTVISLLKNQASFFDVEEKEIGLEDIDPDGDLLSPHKKPE